MQAKNSVTRQKTAGAPERSRCSATASPCVACHAALEGAMGFEIWSGQKLLTADSSNLDGSRRLPALGQSLEKDERMQQYEHYAGADHAIESVQHPAMPGY